ncbi:hypothetical protein Cni_G05798 [Canna indica]|uniref:RNase H type-1 domain-containing protein n=1 Tax=Canna indica TaxID=4628 RepID=A0AAQ3Q5C8_9LILI|nr:hypothetical protein Cni_G05798 [Canna indica]
MMGMFLLGESVDKKNVELVGVSIIENLKELHLGGNLNSGCHTSPVISSRGEGMVNVPIQILNQRVGPSNLIGNNNGGQFDALVNRVSPSLASIDLKGKTVMVANMDENLRKGSKGRGNTSLVLMPLAETTLLSGVLFGNFQLGPESNISLGRFSMKSYPLRIGNYAESPLVDGNSSKNNPGNTWVPPPMGYFKINTDGAYNENNNSYATSLICRDYTGKIMTANTANAVILSHGSVLICEAIAVKSTRYRRLSPKLPPSRLSRFFLCFKLFSSGVIALFLERDDTVMSPQSYDLLLLWSRRW